MKRAPVNFSSCPANPISLEPQHKGPEFPVSHYPTKSSEKDLESPANDVSALRIEAAAILSRNGEIFTLPPTNRHYDIGRMMAALRQKRPRLSDMGFLLSDGTWCNRRKAMRIAIASGECIASQGNRTHDQRSVVNRMPRDILGRAEIINKVMAL